MNNTQQERYNLKYKWTVSKAVDTYGYDICTLFVNGDKVSRCNGGGYDMQGTCLGDWIERKFKDDLLQLKETFYGLGGFGDLSVTAFSKYSRNRAFGNAGKVFTPFRGRWGLL